MGKTTLVIIQYNIRTRFLQGVSIHWTELFSLFGQVSVFIFRNESTVFKLTIGWLLWMIVIMAIVVYCSVLSNA